jgi:hypothetical protein
VHRQRGDQGVVPGEILQDDRGLPHRPGNIGAGVEHRIPAASPQQAKIAIPVPVQVLNPGEVFRFRHRPVKDSDVMAMAHGLLHERAPHKPGTANHKKLHPHPRSPLIRDSPNQGSHAPCPGLVSRR